MSREGVDIYLSTACRLMEDRAIIIRKTILNQLESGQLKAGDKLPGTRDLAKIVGVSLVTVQAAIDLLTSEGVLETIPRRGTFVHPQWTKRILPYNISVFRTGLPWLDDLRQLIDRELPELSLSERFTESVFEIRATHWIQSHHNEYLDLSNIFAASFPDTSDFFMQPFNAFRFGKKLAGIPIIYSPRVVFYNPELLNKAGCQLPHSSWTIADLRLCVQQLSQILPPEDVFFWIPQPHYWINFVTCAGGCLFDLTAEEPVKIDSVNTRRGLALFRQLRHDMGLTEYNSYPDNFINNFLTGKAAMIIEPREFLSQITASGFENWSTVPLPHISGGDSVSVQATDAFCVRKKCVNLQLAEQLLKLLLSVEFQDCLGKMKYGLPIRKSATGRSIDYNDPRDMLFLTEIPRMYSHYNLNSVDLYKLVCDGIANLITSNDNINAATAELAEMVRIYLKISQQSQLRHRRSKDSKFDNCTKIH